MGRFSAQIAFTLTLVLLGAFAPSGAAQAQNVDWLVSVSDTGFDPQPAGGIIDYQLSIANNGFDTAGPTEVTFDFPAGSTLVGTSGDLTGCTPTSGAGPGTMTCTVPSLASLGTANQIVQITTDTQGTVSVAAAVPTTSPGGEADILTTNNTDSELTTVAAGADISLSLTAPGTVPAGGDIDFTWVATNNGPDPSDGFTISFPTPAGVINMVPPAGCTVAGSTWSCVIPGVIPVGGTVSRTFTGQVAAASSSDITASASVIGQIPPDPDADNDTAVGTVDVTSGTDVAIDKSRTPAGDLLVGNGAIFTLATSYSGDAPGALTVTDTIPGNYQIDSISTTGGWSCSVSGQDVTCTRPAPIGTGNETSIGDIQVTTTVVRSGSATNTATISSAGPTDQDTTNNSDSDGGTTIYDPEVDLRANKTGPVPALAVVGNDYDFNISTTNIGNTDYWGILRMEDSLPAGLSLNGITANGWSCAPTTGVGPLTVVCTREYTPGSPLGVNATTPQVVLNTTATAPGPLRNALSVRADTSNLPESPGILGNNDVDYTVSSGSGPVSADVAVVKTAAPDPVTSGDILTYSLEITNAGPNAATNVEIEDFLGNLINNRGPSDPPAPQGFVGFSITRGVVALPRTFTCSHSASGATGRDLECDISELPVCTPSVDCPVIEIQVRPGGDAGTRTNTATAISPVTPDPNLANNSDTVSYELNALVDLEIEKTATPDPVDAGQNLTYVLTAENLDNGQSTARDVEIVDTLPANVTFISADGPSATCTTALNPGDITSGGETITCDMGDLGNGVQRSVTVVVRPTNAAQGTTIANSATVATNATPETNLANNADSASVDVTVPQVDLLVNKTDSRDPVAVGETVTYTVRVTNNGPSASESVTMTDYLPTSGVTYQSHTVSGAGSCATVPSVGAVGAGLPPGGTGDLICTWPVIPAGQSETVDIVVLGVTKGAVTNTADVTSFEVTQGWESPADNNRSTQDTTLRSRADVRVDKTGPVAVNLLDNFDFTITLDVLSGPGLAEADDVVLRDILPANVELTGAPTASVAGSTTLNACSGAAGATSFGCTFGTVSAGTTVTITVPVQVTAATSDPYTRTNTASATTSSFDPDTSNDSDSHTVTVGDSSIAGRLYADHNADVDFNGSDFGIGGVTITLTGNDKDGNAVSLTTTTDGSGNYRFRFLPESDASGYTITRGAVTRADLIAGSNEAGTVGGTANGDNIIADIVLPAVTDATGYDFTRTPLARIGIAKQLAPSPATTNADGSFTATFVLRVENFSREDLDNIEVTDPLAGATPLFGTLATPATPATDPLTRGTYTIVSTPSGSCGGVNAGFNGDSDQVVASGITLSGGTTCILRFTLRVQPEAPVPAQYFNQASVSGEGTETGQSAPSNPQLADTSDNGTNPDPNGNNLANEPGENDPTPVATGIAPAIALVKTSTITRLSSPPVPGEEIDYQFAVTNTGNVTLTDITLTDTLAGIVLSGGPIASLAPGATDTTTFTATYAIDQDDIDDGEVINQATVTGTDPYGTDVTDDSGTTNANDTPLTTVIVQRPSIALVKVANTDDFDLPPQEGDLIAYSFTVTNTGNTTLTDITLTDSLPDIVISGGPIASLDPGEIDSTTFTATYALKQADIQAGNVTNTATATGKDPSDAPVSDDSGTANDNDTPTVVTIDQDASILLDKIATVDFADGAVAGDVITYAFTVTNNGNMILTNVRVADNVPGVTVSGGPIPQLLPNEVDTTTFTATYTVTPADIVAGEFENYATATGVYGPDPLDDKTTYGDAEIVSLGTIEALPEPYPPFETDGGTTTTVLGSDTLNNDPATLETVTIRVIREDPGVTLDPGTGLITLAPGYPAGPYEVEYEICSIIVPTLCDTTVETVVQAAIPGIEATKTQTFVDVNGDGIEGIGDRIDYVITVENTGNTPLENVVLTDTLTDGNGRPLTLTRGPVFDSADQGSAEGDLKIGETATYTASFTVTLQAINSGKVENSVLAEALPVFVAGVPGTPTLISDTSDNGIDSDGNTEDDPTVYIFAPSVAEGLKITKTTPDDIVERGQIVPYTITVSNSNTFLVGPVNIVDILPAHFLPVPDSATLDGATTPIEITGLRVVWQSVTLPAEGKVVLTLDARVLNGARSGTHVNTASVVDPVSGATLTGPAKAEVRILPEAVFDCSDVIGRVFDDINGNGYHDDPSALRDGGITDQTYDGGGKGGKGARPPDLRPSVERGLPGVRLVAPDGTVITTDENGLYSVPCAALPADRGSNFLLKLDERTLPTGFRPTTENPRVVRLTPGVMAEINFGATLGKVVRIDLNRAAFTATASGTPVMSPALDLGIRRLVPDIAGEPVVIRLAWHVAAGASAEAVAEGRALMKLVENRLRTEWRKAGRTQLRIETVIVRAGQ